MNGRESVTANNLFFLCSLIEYIGRKTKNHRSVIVNAIGKERLQHIFDLADVYHCENIDKISYELIEKHSIETGHFDNIATAKYTVPTHWDIGKVYKRLILEVSEKQDKPLIAALMEVYNSWLSRKIEDFNSSTYYESPPFLYYAYCFGDMPE